MYVHVGWQKRRMRGSNGGWRKDKKRRMTEVGVD